MTKKRSLLLTGLFAVSGILPCHAVNLINRADVLRAMSKKKYEFFYDLGAWEDREKLLHRYGYEKETGAFSDGTDWSEDTYEKFDEYSEEVKAFQALVNTFNSKRAALTGQATQLLPNDGTGLVYVETTAKNTTDRLLSTETLGKIQQDTETLNTLYKSLQDKIKLAEDKGIDLSDISGANHRPSNKDNSQAVSNQPSTGDSRGGY